MASLFKPAFTCELPENPVFVMKDGKKAVRVVVGGKTTVYPLTKSGTKYLKKATKWYGKYLDEMGTEQRVPLCADKAAAQQKLNDLVKKVDRKRLGLFDPSEDHALRLLLDHLADYEGALAAKGDTEDHVRLTVARIKAVITGCNFIYLRDLDGTVVARWLHTQREKRVPVALPNQVEFTPAETSKLLGISGAAVRAAVKRYRLTAIGNGKARIFPHATVLALTIKAVEGISPTTVNHYIRALRGFTNWLVRSKRIGTNPLGTLTLVGAQADIRHARRELTVEELHKVFDYTKRSARTFRGLSGRDRYHLYLAAASTGFRARALGKLTPADFSFHCATPTVTLAAQFNKSRKPKVQPLPVDAAEQLKEFLADRSEGQLIWGGTWATGKRGAEMLRLDLDDAGIPYIVETPNGPLHADFHALRHSYLTMLGKFGVDLRTAQELAGHSSPLLTARYTHRRLPDLAEAVGKMPSLRSSHQNPSNSLEVGSQTSATSLVPADCDQMHFLARLFK